VQWHVQDFVNGKGKAFRLFSKEPRVGDPRVSPGEFFSNQLRRNRRQKTAAPPPLEQEAKLSLG